MKQAKMRGNRALESAMASQSVVQPGLFMALPMVMEIGLERGFRTALGDFIIMQLQLCYVFFTFSMGTKAHYFGRTVLHGGAKFRAMGRCFVVRHVRFAENYKMYSRSHFTKALELFVLLIVYQAYGDVATSSLAYLLITMSMWFLVVTWLFAPFSFNPSGFEWQKIVEDWEDWNKWLSSRVGSVFPQTRAGNHGGMKNRSIWCLMGSLVASGEIVLTLRFFLFQYAIVYHLHIANGSKIIIVFLLQLTSHREAMMILAKLSLTFLRIHIWQGKLGGS